MLCDRAQLNRKNVFQEINGMEVLSRLVYVERETYIMFQVTYLSSKLVSSETNWNTRSCWGLQCAHRKRRSNFLNMPWAFLGQCQDGDVRVEWRNKQFVPTNIESNNHSILLVCKSDHLFYFVRWIVANAVKILTSVFNLFFFSFSPFCYCVMFTCLNLIFAITYSLLSIFFHISPTLCSL